MKAGQDAGWDVYTIERNKTAFNQPLLHYVPLKSELLSPPTIVLLHTRHNIEEDLAKEDQNDMYHPSTCRHGRWNLTDQLPILISFLAGSAVPPLTFVVYPICIRIESSALV